jgi:hypothetical protein
MSGAKVNGMKTGEGTQENHDLYLKIKTHIPVARKCTSIQSLL